jgi:CPA1 family monovalent cation:H+ antiporter
MKLFNILAILITLSAGFSYINHRFIRLPTTIGLMAIALLASLGLIALGPLGFGLKEDARLFLNSIDFDETLLHGMLSFLLFAGALHVNLADLARQKYIIGGFWAGWVLNCLSYTAFCSVP